MATISINFARDIAGAFKLNTNQSSRGNYRPIGWSFPIAINMDGSSNLEDHRGRFGGLVRTDQGKWVEGFCGYINYVDALKVELWRIKHA